MNEGFIAGYLGWDNDLALNSNWLNPRQPEYRQNYHACANSNEGVLLGDSIPTNKSFHSSLPI